jgi:hypothetical protein
VRILILAFKLSSITACMPQNSDEIVITLLKIKCGIQKFNFNNFNKWQSQAELNYSYFLIATDEDSSCMSAQYFSVHRIFIIHYVAEFNTLVTTVQPLLSYYMYVLKSTKVFYFRCIHMHKLSPRIIPLLRITNNRLLS